MPASPTSDLSGMPAAVPYTLPCSVGRWETVVSKETTRILEGGVKGEMLGKASEFTCGVFDPTKQDLATKYRSRLCTVRSRKISHLLYKLPFPRLFAKIREAAIRQNKRMEKKKPVSRWSYNEKRKSKKNSDLLQL